LVTFKRTYTRLRLVAGAIQKLQVQNDTLADRLVELEKNNVLMSERIAELEKKSF